MRTFLLPLCKEINVGSVKELSGNIKIDECVCVFLVERMVMGEAMFSFVRMIGNDTETRKVSYR